MTRATAVEKFGFGRGGYLSARAEFEFNGRDCVAIETKRGAFEIYVVDPADGIEMFAGYFGDVAARNPGLAIAAIEALS